MTTVEGGQELRGPTPGSAPSRAAVFSVMRALTRASGIVRVAGREDQVGPQLALDEDAQRRPPVVEEGGDRAGRVDGRELVDARRAAGGGPAARPR